MSDTKKSEKKAGKKVESGFDKVKDKVNSVLEKYPSIDEPLSKFAKNIKTDKAIIVMGIALTLPFLFYSVWSGGCLVIDLIGFIYPMYASIKAIESTGTEDDTIWLTYWIIFGLFKTIEGSADFLLQYIPFYMLIKAAFLVWCYYPKTQGAKVIYDNVIKPHVVPALGIGAESKKKD